MNVESQVTREEDTLQAEEQAQIKILEQEIQSLDNENMVKQAKNKQLRSHLEQLQQMFNEFTQNNEYKEFGYLTP